MIESRSGRRDFVRRAVAVICCGVNRIAVCRAGRIGRLTAHSGVIKLSIVALDADVLSLRGRSVFSPNEINEDITVIGRRSDRCNDIVCCVAVIACRIGGISIRSAGRIGISAAHRRVIELGIIVSYAVILSLRGRSVFSPDELCEAVAVIESRVSGNNIRVAVAVIGRRVSGIAGSGAGRAGHNVAHFRVIVNRAVAP